VVSVVASKFANYIFAKVEDIYKPNPILYLFTAVECCTNGTSKIAKAL